jgi:membrane-associated protease RseP (regulator of RpoE activity)
VYRWLRRLICSLVALVIGVPFALLLAWQALIIGVNYGLGVCLLFCGGGLLSFFALLAIHELGHLLVARGMGLPFQRFTVGLLQLVREDDRVRVRLNTAWFQPAAYVMHGPCLTNGWRWAAVILAGPLSNLLLGAACLAVASGLNPGAPADMPPSAQMGWRSVALLFPGGAATAWLNLSGLLSLGLGLGTLVPGFAAGMRTDGGQLLDLWQGKGPQNQPLQRAGALTAFSW